MSLLPLIICISTLTLFVSGGGVSLATTTGIPKTTDNSAITKYLQNELASISTAHNSIRSFLREKRIPIGDQPRSLQPLVGADSKQKGKLMVTLSDESNDIECRVALEKAPIGSKCVAPCGCTGSQQWIQFAVLNRMRRSEPSQWVTCQTCQQKFDYSSFITYGGEVGNVISAVLDNPLIFRTALVTTTAILFCSFSIGNLLLKFSVSRFFWQLYPHWSRIVNLPLVLKFWGGKILFTFIFEKYLFIEKLLAKKLTEIESRMIEERLPVTVVI